jgi:hypothetical protein
MAPFLDPTRTFLKRLDISGNLRKFSLTRPHFPHRGPEQFRSATRLRLKQQSQSAPHSIGKDYATRQELFPTTPFLDPDISDADARLADYPSTSPLVSGHKSAPLRACGGTIPRMDAMPYDRPRSQNDSRLKI